MKVPPFMVKANLAALSGWFCRKAPRLVTQSADPRAWHQSSGG